MEVWRLFCDAWALLVRHHHRFLRAVVWVLAFQVVALAPPFIIASIYDDLSRYGALGRDRALVKAAICLVVLIGLGFMKGRKDAHARAATFRIARDFPSLCLEKFMRLPISFHERENTGMAMGKVLKGVSRLLDLSFMVLHEILPLVGMAVVTISMVLYYDWRVALVILAVMAVFGSLAVRTHARFSGMRRDRHDLDNEADAHAGQTVTNATTTQVFVQERRETDRQRGYAERIHAMLETEYDSYEHADVLRNGLVNVAYIGIIAWCIRMVSIDRMGIGTIVLIAGLADRLFSACYRIGWFYSKTVECIEPVRRIIRLLELPETVKDPDIPVPVERFVGEVSFRNVSYGYRTGDPSARPAVQCVRDVWFTVKPGETVAIVGESGAGKSTLAKLLFRFDDPDRGSILIDGMDLRHMAKGDFRRQIGYVSQEVEMYDLTVGENIAYGRPEASRTEIEKAARMAGALDFITCDLEKGFSAPVGNLGKRLSGGQRQRIGIARALLLDPPILLFDEATSNVDVVTEAGIQRTIRELCVGRTVILIAHRLSTVRHADRILVMDRGMIVEAGTHQDLVAKGGAYARLVRAQERAEQLPEAPPDRNKLLN